MIDEELMVDLDELSLRALQSVQNEEEPDAQAVKAALNQLSNPELFAAKPAAAGGTGGAETGDDSGAAAAAKAVASAVGAMASAATGGAEMGDAAAVAGVAGAGEAADATGEAAADGAVTSEATAALELEKAPLSVGEREYLQNIRERLLVLFTALQDDDGERYGQITVEFLEFLLASIEARLSER